MNRLCLSLLVLAVLPGLSSCVAALIPIAAVGALGKNQIDRTKAKRALVASGAIDLALPAGTVTVGSGDSGPGALPRTAKKFTGQGGASQIVEVGAGSDAADYFSQYFQPVAPDASPYANFATFALQQSARVSEGEGVQSVVLIPRVDVFKPETVACDGKPLAVVIDLDDKAGRD